MLTWIEIVNIQYKFEKIGMSEKRMIEEVWKIWYNKRRWNIINERIKINKSAMNYSLYLTDSCNLNCKYCYEKKFKTNRELSFDNIKKIIDNEIKSKSKESIITFFGGEPLLKKVIIYSCVKISLLL